MILHLNSTQVCQTYVGTPGPGPNPPPSPVTGLTTLRVTPGSDGLVMCDVVCYALHVTCVTRYTVVTRRVMYSPVLSQYNIMHHNERCEETRCYTISKLLPSRPFR